MKDSFATRLKGLMDDRQINGAELGRRICVSQQAVSKWLHGGNIEFNCLRALGNYFDVDWVWLGFGDEELQRRGELRASDALERRRQAHIRQVMESEERLRRALEMARIAIWEWNLITNEMFHSNNDEQFFGTSVQRFEQFMALVPKTEHDIVQQAIEHALEQPAPFAFTHHLLNPLTEQSHKIAERWQALSDHDGRPVRILGASIVIIGSLSGIDSTEMTA